MWKQYTAPPPTNTVCGGYVFVGGYKNKQSMPVSDLQFYGLYSSNQMLGKGF